MLFQKIQCWWTRAHKTYSKIPLLFPVKAYQGQQCNDSTASTNNTKIEIFFVFVYVVKLIYAFFTVNDRRNLIECSEEISEWERKIDKVSNDIVREMKWKSISEKVFIYMPAQSAWMFEICDKRQFCHQMCKYQTWETWSHTMTFLRNLHAYKLWCQTTRLYITLKTKKNLS